MIMFGRVGFNIKLMEQYKKKSEDIKLKNDIIESNKLLDAKRRVLKKITDEKKNNDKSKKENKQIGNAVVNNSSQEKSQKEPIGLLFQAPSLNDINTSPVNANSELAKKDNISDNINLKKNETLKDYDKNLVNGQDGRVIEEDGDRDAVWSRGDEFLTSGNKKVVHTREKTNPLPPDMLKPAGTEIKVKQLNSKNIKNINKYLKDNKLKNNELKQNDQINKDLTKSLIEEIMKKTKVEEGEKDKKDIIEISDDESKNKNLDSIDEDFEKKIIKKLIKKEN